MKSYTDISQSKVLAEILPLESADMSYGIDDDTLKYDDLPWLIPYHKYTAKEYYIPCWSLATLLDVLPFPQLSKDKLGSGKVGWMVSVYPDNCRTDSHWHDNPIDACYEMIINLKGLKLL